MSIVKPVGKWITFVQIVRNSASGIILPDQSEMQVGMIKQIVREVGDEVTKVVPGDEIMIIPNANAAIKLEFPERNLEKDLFLTKEEFLMARIVDEPVKVEG